LIVYKISVIRTFFISTLISYLLIGMYEFSRFLFDKIKGTFSISLWSKFKILSIIFPLVLIYSSMITLNIPPLQINKKYYINSFYKENASFTSLQEAESLARVAVDDKNSYIKLSQGNSENFTNRYIFSIGDYSVEIDGATGKIFQITMLNENKINVKGNLNEEEIKGKTISWLKKIGFTYSENKSLIKIEKQTNQYTVNIFNKYNDGSVDDRSSCSIQWYDNGKLCSAIIGSNLFDLKDYKEIKIDESAINSNIKKWYEKSGESAPSYIIDSFSYWIGENNTYIQVKCKNNDSLGINPYNGQIVNFNKNKSDNEKITQEIYEKNNSKAEQLAKIYSNSWNNLNYKLEDTSFNENGNYTFISNKGILTNLINVKLDFQGNISAFSEINNSFSKTKLYSDKAFKISSTTALTLIANKYMPFGIYTKRVKLAVEVNEKGNINYKWMVMVVPFKDVEHQIYYVDVNTGKIDPLLDYK